MKILTKTASGNPILITARSGIPEPLRQTGRLTAMATGFGFLPGDGPGWMMRPGASRRSTTAAGLLRVANGVGCLLLHGPLMSQENMCVQSTRLPWLPGLAARTLEWALQLAAWLPALHGSHSVRAMFTHRRIT